MLPEKQTQFNPTEKEDKYYFSAFFNEALQNAAAIIKHIKRRMDAKYTGNKFPEDDKIDENELHDTGMLKIENGKQYKDKLIQAVEIRAMLSRYFILLETFKEDKVTRQFYFLRCIFKLAASCRNYYSHANHNCITLTDALEEFLPKENKKKTNFKIEDFKICFEKCFKHAVNEARRRFDFSEEIEALFITKEGKNKKKINENYALFTDDGKNLSEKGIHFLFCLLLTKERANLYISRIRGFKGTHTEKFLATRQVFTAFCAKPSKAQLVSGENEQALTLDLMNYLAKCPQPLYNQLNEEDKTRFITQEGDEEAQEGEDKLVPTTRMTRNLDRAFYFLARFIDSHPGFNANFCVQLGKWRIAEYKNGNVERNIDQNVYQFSNLGDIKKQDDLERAKENNELKRRLSKIVIPKPLEREWIQYAPHYAKQPHAFSINFLEKKEDEKKKNKGKENDPKIIIGKKKIKTYSADLIKQQATDFTLSYRSLPLISMLLLLNEQTKDENYQVDKLLITYSQSVENFLEELEKEIVAGNRFSLESIKSQAEKHHLKIKWLPRQLIKALIGNLKPFDDQVQQKLQEEIDRTKEYGDFLSYMTKLRNSNKESEERIKYQKKLKALKGKYIYKTGNVAADFLKDFWRFTTRRNGKMPNSSEYQTLQKKLALYTVHRHELDRHFKSLGFDHRNPFYKSLIKNEYRKMFFSSHSTIQNAYKDYLKEKEKQLKKIQYALKTEPEKWQTYYKVLFALKLPVTTQAGGKWHVKDLKKEKELKNYIYNLKKALQPNGKETDTNKKTPRLGVPYDFWSHRFVEFIQKHEPDIAAGIKTLNPVKLIEKYLEKKNEGTQEFYDWKRTYSFNEEEETQSVKIEGNPDELHRQVKEQLKKANELQKKELKKILTTEAAIRYAQSQDRVLWLCAKWRLKKYFDVKESEKAPKLKNYAGGYNDTESHNPLEQSYDFHFDERQDHYTFTIQVKNTKLRDIGKVHALRRDKRLPTLLKLLAYWAKENVSNQPFTLSYTELKQELERYEDYRLESLRLVQKFERALCKNSKKGSYDSLSEILKETYEEGTPYYTICLALRNSWSHNEYPCKWEIEISNELTGEKKKEKKWLFDMDASLKSAYLKHIVNENEKKELTLHLTKKNSLSAFWYKQTEHFFSMK